MIKTFKNKNLKKLFDTGKSAKIDPQKHGKILRLLDVLNSSSKPEDMNLPGFGFHPLQGVPQRYAVSVNGPWRITFGWDDDGAIDIDFIQYH